MKTQLSKTEESKANELLGAIGSESFRDLLIKRGIPATSVEVSDSGVIVRNLDLTPQFKIKYDLSDISRFGRIQKIEFINCTFIATKRSEGFSFAWSMLNYAEFTDCKFFNCGFFRTSLRCGKFIRCDFERTVFKCTDLMMGKFTDCTGLDDTIFLDCNVESSDDIEVINVNFNVGGVDERVSYSPKLGMVYHEFHFNGSMGVAFKTPVDEFLELSNEKAKTEDSEYRRSRYSLTVQMLEMMMKIHKN